MSQSAAFRLVAGFRETAARDALAPAGGHAQHEQRRCRPAYDPGDHEILAWRSAVKEGYPSSYRRLRVEWPCSMVHAVFRDRAAAWLQRFLLTGLRFSMKAAMPSERSSSAKVE